jgi:FkbM family methyltransferase
MEDNNSLVKTKFSFAAFLRKLPFFNGKARLARILMKNNGVTFDSCIVKGRDGIKYFVPNTFDTIGFFILIDGIYERKVSRFIVNNIVPGGIFLDLGINIGAISLPVARKRKDVQIVGVEAAEDVYAILERNIALNQLGNVIGVKKVLSDSDGDLIPFYSILERFGKGSISPVFSNEAKLVSSVTIDKLVSDHSLTQVDLIKADVEGYEYVVFKGGRSLLSAPNAPDIIFEFAAWAEGIVNGIDLGDSQRILLEYGYKLYEFYRLEKGPLTKVVDAGSMLIFASKKPPHEVMRIR